MTFNFEMFLYITTANCMHTLMNSKDYYNMLREARLISNFTHRYVLFFISTTLIGI